MKITKLTPDNNLCPICGKSNACGSVQMKQEGKPCWCNDPKIVFTDTLLAQVPQELRGKACVCRSCALKYQ
ncbi:cysteine-rich CWC family protein [Paraferrimonas sedimenticola]|uniref:cysteine-rich CWC family protein n=1 Tax=Paraferrimonas sedimenticola TaxID=375674 RepID=UPI000BA8EBC5|nr:cysteine-rich CWC family protein [Paraferrimonas sedimenticola]